MKIACVGYRPWALEIYDNLKREVGHNFLIIRSKVDFNKKTIIDFEPDIVLFYGWSWIIDPDLVDRYKCVMLHPSKLPKFRGGSPIQNQIASGVTDSAVTLFIMDEGIDTGNIIFQEDFSLSGHMDEIFERLVDVGTRGTLQFLNGNCVEKKQDSSHATYYKRRSPRQSELTIEELKTLTGKEIYDKIRMLEDPYPNAYIKTIDGKKIRIKLAELE